jgi:hypothetical protein
MPRPRGWGEAAGAQFGICVNGSDATWHFCKLGQAGIIGCARKKAPPKQGRCTGS